jgi:hypothetical protein
MDDIKSKHSDATRKPGCSCCHGNPEELSSEITRRKFVQMTGTGALGTVALSGLSWSTIMADQTGNEFKPQRLPLVVKPVLTYEVPSRRDKTSWRSWGGIQTENDAVVEVARIQGELKTLNSRADFPMTFLPVASARTIQDLNNIKDLESADMFLIYAAGGGMNMFDVLNKMGKNIIFFCRYNSGPVYLWYEIISPRYLRQHTDKLSVTGTEMWSLTTRMSFYGG